MVAGVSGVTLGAIDPHVRAIDAWRDGAAVADLLETSFREEGIDDNGQRMIRMLRSYGPLEAIIMEGAPGFVWVEEGHVLGNASMQYNPAKRGTMIVGNVATHPDHRHRGIASALMNAILQYARGHGARTLALQVVEGNTPAVRLYEKLGFRPQGAVTYYQRPSVRMQPPWHDVSGVDAGVNAGTNAGANVVTVRNAYWADRDAVWRAASDNIPEELTDSDPFDPRTYQLGLRWTLMNWFGGNREHWWVAETKAVPGAVPAAGTAAGTASRFVGALRARANFEVSQHNVELLLTPQATAEQGIALLERALKFFETYIPKPLLATQSRPHLPSHEALQATGFKPTRTLIHMRLEL
jgi:GNAT superfamily N-acetyltransferase